jgi:hypothetical protein
MGSSSQRCAERMFNLNSAVEAEFGLKDFARPQVKVFAYFVKVWIPMISKIISPNG